MTALLSILRAVRGWRRHQHHTVDGSAQRHESFKITDKARNRALLHKDRSVFSRTDLLGHREGNFSNPIYQSEVGRAFEIDDRGIRANDRANRSGALLNNVDSRLAGFVGHDHVPWIWDDRKQCLVPATESSRAEEYARLQTGSAA